MASRRETEISKFYKTKIVFIIKIYKIFIIKFYKTKIKFYYQNYQTRESLKYKIGLLLFPHKKSCG